jgi:hypothetical protein
MHTPLWPENMSKQIDINWASDSNERTRTHIRKTGPHTTNPWHHFQPLANFKTKALKLALGIPKYKFKACTRLQSAGELSLM